MIETILRVTDCPGGVLLRVRVIARARRTEIAGLREGALVIRVTSPPVEGAANDALLDTVAALLEVPRRQLTISQGAHSRDKRVRVGGLGRQEILARVERHLASPPNPHPRRGRGKGERDR